MKHYTAALLVALHGLAVAGTNSAVPQQRSPQVKQQGIPSHEIKDMQPVMLAQVVSSKSLLDDNNLKTAKPIACQPGKGAPVAVVASGSASDSPTTTMALVRVDKGRCAGQAAWVRATHLASLQVAHAAR